MEISPVISIISNAYVLDLFIFLIIIGCGYIVIIFLSYLFLRWVENRYRRLRKNLNLLEAIIKDVEEVLESGRKIDEKPNQLRDSQLKPGNIVQLSDADRDWVEETKAVVHKVQGYEESYRTLTETRESQKSIYSVVRNFISTCAHQAELGSCNAEISDQIRKTRPGICKSLERSRFIVRSLQDRPIEEDNSSLYLPGPKPGVSIARKLKFLMAKNPNLVTDKQKEIDYSIKLPQQLLHAFLQDLAGIPKESETAKAWVDEAVDIISDMHNAIDSIQKTADRMRWFPYIGNWWARRQFKKSFSNIKKRLWDLFYKKVLFDFTFIRRVAQKSVDRSPKQKTQATTDDKEILNLLDKFRKQINQEQLMVASQLEELPDYFDDVNQVLIDAKAVQEGMPNSIKEWNNQMKIIVKDAMRCVSLSASQRRNRSSQKETDLWRNFSAENDLFVEALRLLSISIRVCRIELRVDTISVVGLEDDVHDMASQLTTETEPFSILPIVGMEGIGKTTLAKVVYNHKAIQKHFPFRYWVALPDTVDCNKDVLLKRLGKNVLPNHRTGKEKEYSFKEVNDFLKPKRYLLVLDKVSNKEIWDTLKEAFQDCGNGSRILLITRDNSVASHADRSSTPYQLQLRTNDESWDLFTQMVRFQPEPSQPDQILSKWEKQANEVVKRCGGLPLTILSYGYLLSGKKVMIKDLTRVLDHVSAYQTPWLENFERHEKDLFLDPRLPKCYSYFAQFPRDSEIASRRLVALWVAEGLVQQKDDKQEPLESVAIAKKFLQELIRRNLVQVGERKQNGKVKTCIFPDTLRELWLRERKISDFDVYVIDSTNSRMQAYKNPRSILCFDTQEGTGEDVGTTLRNGIASGHFLQLKVLDLEQVCRPQLPDTVGKLIQLTYLGLRWTYLENIPSSIGNLVNLETLDVNHTYIRTLPSTIGKLQKLQNLYMSEICRGKIGQGRNEKFPPNLQILRGAFVDQESFGSGGYMLTPHKDSPMKHFLSGLKNLRRLELAFQLDLSQQKQLIDSFAVELKGLRTLMLKSIDEMGRPQDLHVNHLSGLVNLSSIYLFGKLKNPSIIINVTGLPQSLTELTLSASGISDDPMPELEKLSKLKSLYFYSGSYTGKTMVCSMGGFTRLEVLKFWMLHELEEWIVEEQAMRRLKKLEIRSCKNLKVSTGLKHIKTIRELKVKDMPLEFTKDINEIIPF
ncbi:hypothetical protein ACJW30_05G016000 [Castanea mollissima]